MTVHSVSARIRAIRPSLAGLEIEAELSPGAVPEGVESPSIVHAAAPVGARLRPGDEIRLSASLDAAFVFPCLDKGCRA